MKAFAIKFRDGRYFITSSLDPLNTTRDFALRGYDPIGIESIIENAESYHEWVLFRDYLGFYGIDKVRSETYPTWDLTHIQKASLDNFIDQWAKSNMDLLCGEFKKVSVEKLCNRCGAIHDVKQCFATHDINGNQIYD